MGQFDGHRQRLKDRFLAHGLDVLPDHQILELLLFYAVPRQDTNSLARRLLEQFGSLHGVLEATVPDLTTVDGIGTNTATLLHMIVPLARQYMLSRTKPGTVLSSTQACGRFLAPYFLGATKEKIYVLCLDAKCKVICCQLLMEGSLNCVELVPRKAAEIAMRVNAASVVLAHNHTSGLPVPSKEDIDATRMVQESFSKLGIVLSDHIIIGDGDFVSMAESKTL